MKNFIFLFLLIPALSYAQFEVNYDPITNTVSVNYSGCDICLLGNAGAVQTCNCRNECVNEDYEDCYSECLNEPYSIDEYYCKIDCAEYYGYEDREDYQSCFQRCGEEPEPVREIIGFGYRLVAAWDVIPFDPRFDQSQWEIFDSETIESNNVIIPNWNPPSPWPEIHSGNNTCYAIGIRIFYQEPDGSVGFCDFTEWDCNIIG